MYHSNMMQIINNYWAKTLSCDLYQIASPGISIVSKPEPDLDQPGTIFIFKGRYASVLNVPTSYIDYVVPVVKKIPRLIGVSGKRLMALIRSDHISVRLRYSYYDYYLPSSNFLLHHPGDGFSIRKLSQKDIGSLKTLLSRYQPEEITDLKISFDDPAVYGCFDNHSEELIAVASLSPVDGIIAEVRVLTDHSYRRKGIGKAVVSALCEWGLERDYVLRFQSQPGNESASALARGIGFVKCHTLESLDVTTNVNPPNCN